MSSYNRILGYDRFTGSWNNIACNSTGALYVTGLSGGSGSGDASAANQVLQLEQAQESNIALFTQLETQTDRLLYDLDIIANRLYEIEGNVTVTNQIAGFSTESKQDTLITETQNSNIAQYGQLALIAEAGEISTSYLQGISTKLSGLPRGTASYTLAAKTTLAPDTIPAYTQPLSGIPASDGWYYKNLALGNTSQLYYYANIATQTKNYDYQIAAAQSQFAVVRILSLNATAGLPFLAVYSQPTGSGDAVPGFYKSRWVYTIGSTQELRLGEQVMIYRGVAPDSRIYPNVRRVECVLSGTVGPANTLEILAYATLNTESGAAIGNAEYVVKGAGLTFAGDHIYEVELTAESEPVSAGDASAANQLTQITRAEQSNTAICTRLDKNTYGNNGNLFVYDTRAESKIIDCVTELQSVNGTLTNLTDGTQQIWVHTSSADDSIEIHGYNPILQMPEAIHTVDNSAKVYINNVVDSLLLAKSGLNNVYLTVDESQNLKVTGAFYPETQPVSGSVSVSNFPESQAVTGTFFQASQPVEGTVSANVKSGDTPITFSQTGENQYSLDVHVNNSNIQVTGDFYQATQPVSIDKLSFTAGDELIVYDDYTFQELQSLNGKVLVCDTGNVTLSNQISGFALESSLSSLNGKVTVCDTGNTNIINSSLDTHLYGEHNATWTAVSVASNGHLLVDSATQDGAGNDITSTAVTGTETYTALDVKCRGTTTISGGVTASIETGNGALTSTSITTKNALDVAVQNTPSVKATQYGSFGNLANNIASILPAGSTAGIDVSDWSYFIGYYEDYYSGPFPSGSLRIQYSFDNITYYNFFNTQIFPSGTGTPRAGNIQKQDIPGINWIRFFNDTNETMVSVTITLFGASI